MRNQLLLQSWRWFYKNWTFSTSRSATINVVGFGCPRLYPYIPVIPWHGYTVMCGYAKSDTVPIPTKPMTLNLWVFPYLWQTLVVWWFWFIQVPVRHHGGEHNLVILVFVLIIVHDEVQLSHSIIDLLMSCFSVVNIFHVVLIVVSSRITWTLSKIVEITEPIAADDEHRC